MPRFVDIGVGTKFSFEGKEYIKIKDERITCCKVNNAVLATDTNNKTMIIPVSEVTVVEEQ